MTRYTTSQTVSAPSDGTYAIGCWGGGGGGGNANNGGGGGGGAFSFASVAVTAGQNLVLTIGAGGAPGSAGVTTTVVRSAVTLASAFGGSAGGVLSAGAGGTTGGVGSTKFAGGAGGVGDDFFIVADNITDHERGGGGGAAGRGGAGTAGVAGDAANGIVGTGGAGNTSYTGTNYDGGNGGNGFSAGVAPGGGGGGSGAGGLGAVELVFTPAAEVAPVITPSTTTFNQPENSAFSQDYDADNPVTWSIPSGTDAAKFSIDSNGTLTLPAKDYEAPDDSDANRVYACTIRATNTSNALTTNKSITVTITNVVDETPPTITTNASQTVPENSPLSVSLVADETVTWDISAGNDLAAFQVGGTGDLLQWAGNGTQDYEAPADSNADNAYNVTVRATDSSGNQTTKAITVTVTNVTVGDVVDTGLKLPTTGTNDTASGTVAWTNPGNITADDAAYARFTNATAATVSNVLTATGYDLSSIPDGAAIVGIAVTVEGLGTSGSGSKNVNVATKIKGTSTAKSFTVGRTTTLQTVTLGGATDVWGLTGADLTGVGLKSGFSVTMQGTVSSGTGTPITDLDYAKVQVWYIPPYALTANATTPASPVIDSPALGQIHPLVAAAVTTASPAMGTPALGQAHGLTANPVTTASPQIANRVPDGGFEGGMPATTHYSDGGGTNLSVITNGGAHSGSRFFRTDAIGGHQFIIDGATFVAAGKTALLSVWLKDSGLAGTWGATGYADQPHGLSLWLTTLHPSGYVFPQAIPAAGSGGLHALPAAGSGWTLYTQVVTGLVPGTTYYTVLQPNYYEGSRQLDIDDLLVSDLGLGQVHGLTVANMATASPAISSPAMVVIRPLVANNLAPASPVLASPVIAQIHMLGAAGLTTGPPAFGTATVGQKHALTANAVTTASPVLGTPAIGQKHAVVAPTLAPASPVLGSPALAQVHVLSTAGVATSAPALGAPAMGLIATVITTVAPASVVAAGGWTDQAGGSAIAAAVDETVPDDADYGQSSLTPVDDVLRLKLAPFKALGLYRYATLRYRVGRTGGNATETVRLYQGNTLIGGPWVHSAIALQTFTQAVDPALITDGDDLYLEVEAG